MTDAIGSVSFHPLHPFLLSISGSRHYQSNNKSADFDYETTSDSDSDSESDSDVAVDTLGPQPRDASIKIWDFSKRTVSDDDVKS